MPSGFRVLITGGAGFIGSHLSEAFLQMGHTVTIIDNLSTGRWENVAFLEKNPTFRALIASATERDLVEAEVARHDFVFHLASAVGVKLIMREPVQTIETIFQATDVVLKACSRHRKPILITSTSETYGKSLRVPFREDDDVVMGATEKRRWAYACAKALDEFLGFGHYHESSLPVFIVRLFNVSGPRQTDTYGMVLPTFVRQAMRGEPITVYGTGAQKRCFCHVRDVVEGLIAISRKSTAVGKTINLGSQEEVSILELANLVKTELKSSSEVRFISYKEAYGPGFDDMERRVPCLDRVKAEIGWTPKRNLQDIIRDLAEFERQR